MRRFQYFIDFDGTVRVDNKDDDYPAGNTPWPKLFGIFNFFFKLKGSATFWTKWLPIMKKIQS